MKYFNTIKTIGIFPYLLVFYEIATYLANDLYLPALPRITTDLQTTTSMVQQTLTAWFLGSSSLQLILGPLSDRFGRKPILLVGGLIFICSTLICALTSNLHTLLIARFLQGVVVATLGTAGYASIHESYDRVTVIQILTIMSSIVILAPAFGPLFGGILLQWITWRWLFIILVVWASIPLIGLWFLMPESNPIEKRQALAVHLIVNNYLKILFNKKFILNVLVSSFSVIGKIAWIVGGSFLIVNQFKLNILFFGLFQIMIFASQILAAQLLKNMIKKTNINHLVNIGVAFTLLGGLLAFCLSYIFPHFILGLILSLMIFCAGTSFTATTQRLAIEACPEQTMGERMAVYSTLVSLFCAIASVLVSTTFTTKLTWFGSLLLIVSIFTCLARWISLKIS